MVYDVIIVGGGSGGISLASSLLKRDSTLKIAIIEPSDVHYYQPGWTMVGAGVFSQKQTVKKMASVIPSHVRWIQSSVVAFNPNDNAVILNDDTQHHYKYLVVCSGLTLNWHHIEGLTETLGRNGVTSNYRYDLAPYTWQLTQSLKSGNALFTQPAMPIKCAGAPQKALYLSADYWRKNNVLANVNIQFFTPTDVLFSIKDYVPALMEYIKIYNAKLNFGHNLVKVDGEQKIAYFKKINSDDIIDMPFEMLHVVPPQSAPEFIKQSTLASDNGWLNVNHQTLQHNQYQNTYGLGDVINTPNAKTAAAVRKQVPVVAHNLIHDMKNKPERALYNGYGSCPLTVQRGKIVLAEFGYGGKIMSTFPEWLLNGKKPTQFAWFLKEKIMPLLYWNGMLKGHELLVSPEIVAEYQKDHTA
jgi:sulfide:quinone oxidoreductase